MSNLAQDLSLLLADYQVFYQKLRTYHCTVAGPQFFGLHAKFESLYDDAAEKVDGLAERLLTLGHRPPTTLKRALEIARLREDAEPKSAEQMLQAVLSDMGALVAAQRKLSDEAGEVRDRATANLLDGWSDEQEKTMWMLRATLGVR